MFHSLKMHRHKLGCTHRVSPVCSPGRSFCCQGWRELAKQNRGFSIFSLFSLFFSLFLLFSFGSCASLGARREGIAVGQKSESTSRDSLEVLRWSSDLSPRPGFDHRFPAKVSDFLNLPENTRSVLQAVFSVQLIGNIPIISMALWHCTPSFNF